MARTGVGAEFLGGDLAAAQEHLSGPHSRARGRETSAIPEPGCRVPNGLRFRRRSFRGRERR